MREGVITRLTRATVLAQVEGAVPIGSLAFVEGRALQVASQEDSLVTCRPLQDPKGLRLGQTISFTGSPPCLPLQGLKGGMVVDPLGRMLEMPKTVGSSPLKGTGFWGLGCIEQAFSPQTGESLLLAGDESVGPARLLAMAAACSKADWIVAALQGGQRELTRMVRSLQQSGLWEKSLVVYCSLAEAGASAALLPQALESALSVPRRGKGLVLVDDLRRWLEQLRALGEYAQRDCTPDGFEPGVRALLARIFSLPSGEVNRCGLLLGWSFDRLFPTLGSHPFGPLVEHLASYGALLAGHDEGLVLQGESWGYRGGPMALRDDLVRLTSIAPFEVQGVLEVLVETVEAAFLSFLPENMGVKKAVYTREGGRRLLVLAERLARGDEVELAGQLLRSNARSALELVGAVMEGR